MNYIAQIKGFWLLHDKHAFNSTDIALYFYLLEVCNAANWVNPFRRNTARILIDLKISRSTLERSRKQLNKYGILNFKSVNGTANSTYQLADLEAVFRDKFNTNGKAADKGIDTGYDQGADAGYDKGTDQGIDQLNKNSKQKLKQKPKQAEVVSHQNAFDFFAATGNCRLLKEKFELDDLAIADFFKTFYDSKIDLGDLDNKTTAETARNFYYWLPKHLAALPLVKEKSCAKKEKTTRQLYEQPLRGVAAALKFTDVEMRGE